LDEGSHSIHLHDLKPLTYVKHPATTSLSAMKLAWLIISFISSNLLTAQTGNGGGIQIMNITAPDNAWGSISISASDTALKINYYILSDDSAHTRIKQYHPLKSSFYLFDNKERNALVYVAPYIKEKGEYKFIFNQQLEIIYKKDTMLLDLIDLPGMNANGATDIIEKLNFFPGHYLKSYRDIRKKTPYLFTKEINGSLSVIPGKQNEVDSIENALQNGINQNTYRLLYSYGLLEEAPMLKKYSLAGKEGNEIIYASWFPMYTLKLEQVEYKELLRRQVINISTSDKAVMVDNQLNYKFILNYRFTPVAFIANDPLKNKDSAASRFFSALDSLPLFINHEIFSGTITIVFNSYWYDLSRKAYATYGMIAISYKNGVLISKTVANDVDVYSGRERERPS
jgi:hypothetical protein